MKAVLLIDFGSTYTKLTAVDIENECVLGTSSAHTTIKTNINDGLKKALLKLKEKIGITSFCECFACSSAAGGLRMVTSGLVPELTGEAAKLASLGAGAKTVGIYSYELTEDDLENIKHQNPDIFLLVGGTDGGNTECIIHNAKMLASINPTFPVLIAGNRTAAKECERILNGAEVHICPNVMPKFGVLQVEPAQEKIREIFLNRIIKAKGLDKATEILSDIIMPTPSAVLSAMNLLGEGVGSEKGIGDLIGIDVGGATTDIYSITDGMPEHMTTVYKGLPEPFAKRTVEGDIGMRYSSQGIVDAVGINRICELSGLGEEKVLSLLAKVKECPDALPEEDKDFQMFDYALACSAVDEAVTRHAGTITETYTMMGPTLVQEGKNLTKVKQIVVTGGSLIYTKQTEKIAKNALYSLSKPNSLRPKNAEVWVDEKYIIAAMGLLSLRYPETALRILKKELKFYGYKE